MAGRLLLVCLILAAAALAALAVLRWRGLLLLSHESNPEQWEVFGVDVSSYQGAVDWPVLADQGVDFAFIKATEGSTLRDGRFADNWAGAQAAGVRAGAYHFLSYDTPGETQADNFIDLVPVTEGALPPVVDIEFYGDYLAGGPLWGKAHPLRHLPLLLPLSGGGRVRGVPHLVLQPHGVSPGARLGLLAVLPYRPAGWL